MAHTNISYNAWNEENIENYCGTYSFADFSNYNPEKYLVKDIIIFMQNGQIAVLCKTGYNTDLPENYETNSISNPKLKQNHIEANSWSGFFPHGVQGEFVYKYPSCGKGKVLKGLLAGNIFFERIENESQ